MSSKYYLREKDWIFSSLSDIQANHLKILLAAIVDNTPTECNAIKNVRGLETFLKNGVNDTDKAYILNNLEAIQKRNELPFKFVQYLIENIVTEKYIDINFEHEASSERVDFMSKCAEAADKINENLNLTASLPSELTDSAENQLSGQTKNVSSLSSTQIELANNFLSGHPDLFEEKEELTKYLRLCESTRKDNDTIARIILIVVCILRMSHENATHNDESLPKSNGRVDYKYGLRDNYKKPNINFEKYLDRFKEPTVDDDSKARRLPNDGKKNKSTLDVTLNLLLLRTNDYKNNLLKNSHMLKGALLKSEPDLVAHLQNIIIEVDSVVDQFINDYLIATLKTDESEAVRECESEVIIMKSLNTEAAYVDREEAADILQKVTNKVYTLKKKVEGMSSKVKHLNIDNRSSVGQTARNLHRTLLDLKLISKYLFIDNSADGDKDDIDKTAGEKSSTDVCDPCFIPSDLQASKIVCIDDKYKTIDHTATATNIGDYFDDLTSKIDNLQSLMSKNKSLESSTKKSPFDLSSEIENNNVPTDSDKNKNSTCDILKPLVDDTSTDNNIENTDVSSNRVEGADIAGIKNQINQIMEDAKTKLAAIVQTDSCLAFDDSTNIVQTLTNIQETLEKISVDSKANENSMNQHKTEPKNQLASTERLNHTIDEFSSNAESPLCQSNVKELPENDEEDLSVKRDEDEENIESDDDCSSAGSDYSFHSAIGTSENLFSKGYPCQICDVNFLNYDHLKSHLQSLHHQNMLLNEKSRPQLRFPLYSVLHCFIFLKGEVMCLACNVKFNFTKVQSRIHMANNLHRKNIESYTINLQRDHLKLHSELFDKRKIVLNEKMITTDKIFFNPITCVCYCCTCEKKLTPSQLAINEHIENPKHLKEMTTGSKIIQMRNEAKNAFRKYLKKNKISEKGNSCNVCNVALDGTYDTISRHVQQQCHIDNHDSKRKVSKKVKAKNNRTRENQQGEKTGFVQKIVTEKKEYIMNSLTYETKGTQIKCNACDKTFPYHKLLISIHLTSEEHCDKLDSYNASIQRSLLRSVPHLFEKDEVIITEEMIERDKINYNPTTGVGFCGVCFTDFKSPKEIKTHLEKQQHIDERDTEATKIKERAKAQESYDYKLLTNCILPFHDDNGFCIVCEKKLNDRFGILHHCDNKSHVARMDEVKGRNDLLVKSIIKFKLNKNTESKEEVANDLDKHHIIMENKKYFCKVCECYVVANQSLLLAHIKGVRHVKKMASVQSELIKKAKNLEKDAEEQTGSNNYPVKLSLFLSQMETDNKIEGNIYPSDTKVLFDVDSYGWIEREEKFEMSLARSGWYVDVHGLSIYTNKVECTPCEVSIPINQLAINLHITSESHISKILAYNESVRRNLTGNCLQTASPTNNARANKYCTCRTCQIELARINKSTHSLSTNRIEKLRKRTESRLQQYINQNKIVTCCSDDDDEVNVICIACEGANLENDPYSIIEHIENTNHYECLNRFNASAQRALIKNNPEAYGSDKLFDLNDKHIDVDCIYANHLSKQVYCGVCRCELYPHQRLIDFHVAGKMHRRNLKDLKIMAEGNADGNVTIESDEDDNDVAKDFVSFMEKFVNNPSSQDEVKDPYFKCNDDSINKDSSDNPISTYVCENSAFKATDKRSESDYGDSSFQQLYKKTKCMSKEDLFGKFCRWLSNKPGESSAAKQLETEDNVTCPGVNVNVESKDLIDMDNNDDARMEIADNVIHSDGNVNVDTKDLIIMENNNSSTMKTEENTINSDYNVKVESKNITNTNMENNNDSSVGAVNKVTYVKSIDVNNMENNNDSSINTKGDENTLENSKLHKAVILTGTNPTHEIDLKVNKLYHSWTDENMLKCIPCSVSFINSPENIRAHTRSPKHVNSMFEMFIKMCGNIVTKKFCLNVSQRTWSRQPFVIDIERIYVDIDDKFMWCCLCAISLKPCLKSTVIDHINQKEHIGNAKSYISQLMGQKISADKSKKSDVKCVQVAQTVRKSNDTKHKTKPVLCDNQNEINIFNNASIKQVDKKHLSGSLGKEIVTTGGSPIGRLDNGSPRQRQRKAENANSVDSLAKNPPGEPATRQPGDNTLSGEHGITQTNDDTFACSVCNIREIYSYASAKQHISGRRHQQTLKEINGAIGAEGIRRIDHKTFACDLCSIKVISGEKSVVQHVLGNQHTKNFNATNKETAVIWGGSNDIQRIDMNSFKCNLCQIYICNIMEHITSTMHQVNRKLFAKKQSAGDTGNSVSAVRCVNDRTFKVNLPTSTLNDNVKPEKNNSTSISNRAPSGPNDKPNMVSSMNESVEEAKTLPGMRQIIDNVFACDLCNVDSILGLNNATQHYKGAAHQKQLLLHCRVSNLPFQLNKPAKYTIHSNDVMMGIRRIALNNFVCDICDINGITSGICVIQHIKGANHQHSLYLINKTQNQPPVMNQSTKNNQPPVVNQSTKNNQPPVVNQSTKNNQPPVMNQSTKNNQPPVMNQSTKNNQPPVMNQSTKNNQPPVMNQSTKNNDVTNIPGIRRKNRKTFACDLCHVECLSGENTVLQHVNGARHKMASPGFKTRVTNCNVAALANADWLTGGMRHVRDKTFACDSCDIKVISGEKNAKQHMRGYLHTQSVALKKNETPKAENIRGTTSGDSVPVIKKENVSIASSSYSNRVTPGAVKKSEFSNKQIMKNARRENSVGVIQNPVTGNEILNKKNSTDTRAEPVTNDNLFQYGVNIMGVGFIHGVRKASLTAYTCDFCKEHLSNVIHLVKHIENNDHLLNVRNVKKSTVRRAIRSRSSGSESIAGVSNTDSGIKLLQNVEASLQDRQRVVSMPSDTVSSGDKQVQGDNKSGNFYECKICKASQIANEKDYIYHINGKTHQKKVLRLKQTTASNTDKNVLQSLRPAPVKPSRQNADGAWSLAVRKSLCDSIGIEWPSTYMMLAELDDYIIAATKKLETMTNEPETKVDVDTKNEKKTEVVVNKDKVVDGKGQQTVQKKSPKKTRSEKIELNENMTAKKTKSLVQEIMKTLKAEDSIKDITTVRELMRDSKVSKYLSGFKCYWCNIHLAGVRESYEHLKNSGHPVPHAVDGIELIKDCTFVCWVCEEDLIDMEAVEEHIVDSNHLKNARI